MNVIKFFVNRSLYTTIFLLLILLCVACAKYPNDSYEVLNAQNARAAVIDKTSIKSIYDFYNSIKTLADTAIVDSIQWTPANYDELNVPISYEVEFAKKEDDKFKNAVTLTATYSNHQVKFNYGRLNDMAFTQMSIPSDGTTIGTFIGRVKSYVSITQGAIIKDTIIVYSETFTLNVKTFPSQAAQIWSITGSAVPIGVPWEDDIPFNYEPTLNGNKGGFVIRDVSLNKGEFKIRKDYNWTTNYGQVTGTNQLAIGGSNLTIGTTGKYNIYFDLGFNTPFINTYRIESVQ